MKTVIASLAFISILSNATAQDIIVKTDSTKTEAIVLQISPTELSYKLFNYSEGPLIRTLKTEIAYVIFKNGTVERYRIPIANIPALNGLTRETAQYIYLPELSVRAKDSICEKYYNYKNTIGFNYIAFLNNSIGFNYMRDVKIANMIINVPFAFGYDNPIVTNALYKGEYIEASDKFSYDKMNYQIGLSAMFTPNMKRRANFLVGPSFYYTSFNASTQLNYTLSDNNEKKSYVYSNSFEIKRRHYGANVGIMARLTERMAMTMVVALGYKLDSYNEKDPYGVEHIESIGGTYKKGRSPETLMYANFMWSIGFRF